MYLLLILQMISFNPVPNANWTNLGYFTDQGACEQVAAGIKSAKLPSVVAVVCVPASTPEEKKV